MLCDICLDIFRGSHHERQTAHHERQIALYKGQIAHHDSVRSLQQSALGNCDICRIFWDAIPDVLPRIHPLGLNDIRISTELSIDSVKDTGSKLLLFTVDLTRCEYNEKIFCEPTDGIDSCYDRAVCADVEIGNGKSSDAERPYDYSDWTSSMACARAWIAGCMENHTNCPASRSGERTLRYTGEKPYHTDQPTAYLPTRLIEIDQPETNKVCLRLSSELDSTTSQYATLSHCWGHSQSLKLTSRSFQRFRSGVEVSELAKTFQDAIFTAQALDIKLLWIDSICIFQDSKKDWQQEAGLMTQVYRNSFLNIAASIAADSDAGFLGERASTVEPHVVQTTWTDHPNDSYYVYYEDYWLENFRRMPLHRRAWVFQEIILAPRVLYFCGTQMFWECDNLLACETWPNGLPKYMRMHSLKGPSRPAAMEIFRSKSTRGTGPSGIATDENTALDKASIRTLWIELVIEYSSCNLTFPSDKLIALSGLAKHMERVFNIEYCAGLWGHDMVQGLAWHRYNETDVMIQGLAWDRNEVGGLNPKFPPKTDPIPYRAPSWSWACWDGRISWRRHSEDEGRCWVDVINWEVHSATEDRTGAVTSAFVKLSGYLVTMELHPDLENAKVFRNTAYFDIHCDGKWNGIRCHDFYFDRMSPSLQLHCMPLFIDCHGYLCALLLVPTLDTRGQFRRVGMFRTEFRKKKPMDWNQLGSFKNESWLEYESVDEDGKYTITII